MLHTSQSSSHNLNDLYRSLGTLKHDFRNSALYTLVLERIPQGNLLDIGCGGGHFLQLAGLAGHRARGLEADAGLIELSRALYPDSVAAVQHLSVEELGSILERFDAITMLDVLEHFESDGEVLRSVAAHLNPEGRVIIVVPQYSWLFGRRDASIGHFRRYSRGRLQAMLKDCGLTPVWTRNWNVLGILPYLLAEKVLRRPLQTSLREQRDHGLVASVVQGLLFRWFFSVENRVSFPWGLSLICMAKPTKRDVIPDA
jgi:2-polyprenyl-3-methyl-5-hydroxy-6-metoxy-1,4-benzoquinol methylase